MPELLSRYPGIVVLHDFFLGELFDSPPAEQNHLSSVLFEAHGYRALIAERRQGRAEAIRTYPCNASVLSHANGMIVHSRFPMQLADQWHGPGTSVDWRHIPIPKPIPGKKERQSARQQLGIGADEFVVASFGFVVPFKLNDRLIDAWASSPMSQDRRCRLIFVGECSSPEYVRALQEESRHGNRITITGFVDRETYHAYLESADIAVQLRLRSRGETSAAILDCLAYGIPTIINAHGSAAELPDAPLLKLAEEFSQADLRDALALLWQDSELRRKLSIEAKQFVRSFHDPANAALLYREAIEYFACAHVKTGMPIEAKNEGDKEGRKHTCEQTQIFSRQILIDITDWTRQERTLTQQTLETLLEAPLGRSRIETVHWTGMHYVYARALTTALLEIKNPDLVDSPVEVQAGDIFLQSRSPSTDSLNSAQSRFLCDLEARGVLVICTPEHILRSDTNMSERQAAFIDWMAPILTGRGAPLSTKADIRAPVKDLNYESEYP